MMLSFLFMMSIFVACLVKPELGSDRRQASWAERIGGLKHFLPVLLIFAIVIGSIYAGFATPTESAALGVMAALVLAALHRKLSWKMLQEVIEGTIRTTAMIMFILMAAYFLNFCLASVGLTAKLTHFVTNLGLSPLQTLMIIIGLYVVLGFFVETLSLMVITIPIISPVIIGLGYDPIWFGVILILLIEMALITPPVGLNLYVVQGIRARGSISEVMMGSVPFVIMMFIMIVLLIIKPELALYATRFVN